MATMITKVKRGRGGVRTCEHSRLQASDLQRREETGDGEEEAERQVKSRGGDRWRAERH